MDAKRAGVALDTAVEEGKYFIQEVKKYVPSQVPGQRIVEILFLLLARMGKMCNINIVEK